MTDDDKFGYDPERMAKIWKVMGLVIESLGTCVYVPLVHGVCGWRRKWSSMTLIT